MNRWTMILIGVLALAVPSAALAGPPDRVVPPTHGDCKNPGPKDGGTTGEHKGYRCGPQTPPPVVTPPPVKPPKVCPPPPPPPCACPPVVTPPAVTPPAPAPPTTTTTNTSSSTTTIVREITVVKIVRVKAKPHHAKPRRHHARPHRHHKRHARPHHRAPLFAG